MSPAGVDKERATVVRTDPRKLPLAVNVNEHINVLRRTEN